MSLPSEFVSAFSRPHGMRDFGDHHPLLMALGVLCAVVAVLIFASNMLMS